MRDERSVYERSKDNGPGVKDLKMNGMGINGSGDEWSQKERRVDSQRSRTFV